jgi:N-methylhydantoinase A
MDFLREMEEKGRQELATAEGLSPESIQCGRWVGMRYVGQWYEVDVPFNSRWKDTADMERDFHRIREERFAHCDEMENTEIIGYRESAHASLPKPSFLPPSHKGTSRPRKKREVFFGEAYAPASIYHRGDLEAEARVRGPAIVEEEGSTTVLPPHWTGSVDSIGNLILEKAR